MNTGKQFEQDFKNSIPKGTDIERFKDSATAWNNTAERKTPENKKRRFTPKNICDYIIYRKPTLIYAELKSHKGKSIPYTDIDRQYEQMKKKADKHIDGVHVGYMINFSDLNETYYLPVEQVTHHKALESRKSIEIEFCRQHGIKVHQQLKRTRYAYNVSQMIDEVER